jgi:amino-acid N-acetyltransferase
MRELRIRKAIKEDIPLIKAILKRNNLPYEDVSPKINCFFLGYVKDECVGIGGIEIYETYGLLRSLVIKESLRGNGYGKVLCEELIKYAKRNKIKEIYLLTTTAVDFFNKIGFKEVNRDKVPYIIQNTTEFKYLCPLTAVCMMMKL